MPTTHWTSAGHPRAGVSQVPHGKYDLANGLCQCILRVRPSVARAQQGDYNPATFGPLSTSGRDSVSLERSRSPTLSAELKLLTITGTCKRITCFEYHRSTFLTHHPREHATPSGHRGEHCGWAVCPKAAPWDDLLRGHSVIIPSSPSPRSCWSLKASPFGISAIKWGSWHSLGPGGVVEFHWNVLNGL